MGTASASSEFSLEFEDVTKSFRRGSSTVPVLQGNSATLPRGTVVTVVGPSGAGKSTLLSLCNLLVSIPRRRARPSLWARSPALAYSPVAENGWVSLPNADDVSRHGAARPIP